MPRQADPHLERRILNAAHKLWRRGGEKALTMRAVAKAARTTTPTVYQRFRDRQDILRALLRRIQLEFVGVIEPSCSPQEVAESYLDFALSHRHEYELFYASWSGRESALRESRPGFELMKRKLSEWMGGAPEQHARLTLVLWALAHGTATLLSSKTVPKSQAADLRGAYNAAVRAIVANASVIRGSDRSSDRGSDPGSDQGPDPDSPAPPATV
jgi:AcrR family transcriptional regulator